MHSAIKFIILAAFYCRQQKRQCYLDIKSDLLKAKQ